MKVIDRVSYSTIILWAVCWFAKLVLVLPSLVDSYTAYHHLELDAPMINSLNQYVDSETRSSSLNLLDYYSHMGHLTTTGNTTERATYHEEDIINDNDPTIPAMNNSSNPPPLIAGKDDCGIWLAMSTIPGAGLGLFAGKNYSRGDMFLQRNGKTTGDHVIPIVDTANFKRNFLLTQYTWSGSAFRLDNLGQKGVSVASMGIGGPANCIMDFVNIQEESGQMELFQEFHRSQDPGVGAITYHHSRKTTATKSITKGQELFVAYGDEWFTTRPEMETVPVAGDHARAETLFQRFQTKFFEKESKANSKGKVIDPTILKDMWNTFVVDNNRDVWKSRTLGAFPPKKDYDKMMESGRLFAFKKQSQLVRSSDWLEQHGVCADLLYSDVSTLPQAGHGAFASIFLPQNSAILPIPLVHIPNRTVLDMQYPSTETTSTNRNNIKQQQLLLNYCLGHRESSMVLSPYGPGIAMINHNQSLANVRLQWAVPERSNHHPEVLQENIRWFQGHTELGAVLAMELVTLRDIQPGEEIFLDYGNEWETAWQDHVRQWQPAEAAHEYVSAAKLNDDEHNRILRTKQEQVSDPYPTNVMTTFDRNFHFHWNKILERDGNLTKLREISSASSGKLAPCEILERQKVVEPFHQKEMWLYTAMVLVADGDKPKEWVQFQAPREAFWFADRPYTSDMFLPDAFRHDIRIPDDMFPNAWKNLLLD